MAREVSPYEGKYDRTGLACLGRVVSIDSKTRRLRAKTLGMPQHGVDDLDLYNVRILHGQWHPEGDEEVSLPRVGTYGVILFIGTEAIWMGSMPLDMSSGERQRENQVKLDAGDHVIKTIAGNRFIMRTGGTIEVQSTSLCRTFWIPSENLITAVCQNFELETSGGHLKWKLDKQEETTNLRLKAWNSLTPDNGITVDIGTVPEANNEESEDAIKSAAAPDLVFDFRQGTVDGELNFKPRSLRLNVQKDGSMYLDIGPSKFTMKIDAATGDVTFETKGTVKGLVKKDVDLTVEGQVTAKVTKDVTINVDGKVSATVKGDVSVTTDAKATVTAKGGATVSTDGDAKVDAKGKVSVEGKAGVNIKSAANVLVEGTKGTDVGSGASPTNVLGSIVNLAGGGVPIARVGDQVIGIGNLGLPTVGQIASGSPKVTSG